ncbi:hypothetical protein L2E82_25055 [Cichorium intybus]|uniref:Uncharacterized protein n=1 Tax=Cichorium intybus TaxID=13427 RepID=A0ACB9E3J7_CICIN|nr:hypothetical protein L2E82_25055 [Cichorium intybus]
MSCATARSKKTQNRGQTFIKISDGDAALVRWCSLPQEDGDVERRWCNILFICVIACRSYQFENSNLLAALPSDKPSHSSYRPHLVVFIVTFSVHHHRLAIHCTGDVVLLSCNKQSRRRVANEICPTDIAKIEFSPIHLMCNDHDGDDETCGLSKGYGFSVLILICTYVAGFGLSWGSLGWLIPSEIFPLEIRQR